MTDSEDGPAVRSTQTKEAARRDAQTARKRRSRAAHATAAPADDAAARLDQNKVARREADAARRRRSRAADADATASRSNVCGVVCVCRC